MVVDFNFLNTFILIGKLYRTLLFKLVITKR